MTDALSPTEPRPARSLEHGTRSLGMAHKVIAAVIVGGLAALTAHAIEASHHDAGVLGPGLVTLDVHIDHSHFDIGTLRVREGTLVRFVVHNGDPIDHELVVGDAAVHQRHTVGTERRHPPVPGEVSVAPNATSMTFYEFNTPGTLVYACHLPGHIAYGMRGTIEVVDDEHRRADLAA